MREASGELPRLPSAEQDVSVLVDYTDGDFTIRGMVAQILGVAEANVVFTAAAYKEIERIREEKTRRIVSLRVFTITGNFPTPEV